jgi:hypothetical protein
MQAQGCGRQGPGPGAEVGRGRGLVPGAECRDGDLGKGLGARSGASNGRGRGPVPGAAVGRVPGADAGRGRVTQSRKQP